MDEQNLRVKIKNVACALGILQGISYTILAIICIAIYNQSLWNFQETSYMDIVDAGIYALFLGPFGGSFGGQILIPEVFTAFAWIYLILHLTWIGVSIDTWRRKGVVSAGRMKQWSLLTLVICLWDFITVVILGVDYDRCSSWSINYSNLSQMFANQMACGNFILPVLVIAAKGFVLWFINVFLSVVLYLISKEQTQGPQQPLQHVSMVGPQVVYPKTAEFAYAPGYSPYGQGPNSYGQEPNAYYQVPNTYGQGPNPYGQVPNTYGQGPNTYGQVANSGPESNRYGQVPNPYSQPQQQGVEHPRHLPRPDYN